MPRRLSWLVVVGFSLVAPTVSPVFGEVGQQAPATFEDPCDKWLSLPASLRLRTERPNACSTGDAPQPVPYSASSEPYSPHPDPTRNAAGDWIRRRPSR